jgi:hypothetical protein
MPWKRLFRSGTRGLEDSEIRFLLFAAMLGGVVPGDAAMAQQPASGEFSSSGPVTLSAGELFVFADNARDAGDFATAESAYRALASNPEMEIRTEARFRLAMMLADRMGKFREAAIEFRAILDEKRDAARVRLELARMHAMLGNLGAAEREFRAAEAAGLPPEVERMVRFYANALSEQKAFGGSVEVALAPDSNINRATRSDTLGTVIGDFTLDEDAKARSGVGLSLRGQAYWREGLAPGARLLVRLSADADLYRNSRFDDVSAGLQVGPEYDSGRDRIQLSAGPTWRWYGLDPYSFGLGINAGWQHPVGKRAQMRINAGVSHVDNRRNALQDAESYLLSASLDRAVSARFGGGGQVFAAREDARDPGYATTSGGASIYAFREIGRTTAVVTLGYSRLEADERLFLYPRRRVDDRFSASIAGTFRSLRIGSFAPLARLRWERNISRVEIYDYGRISAEFGISSAF